MNSMATLGLVRALDEERRRRVRPPRRREDPDLASDTPMPARRSWAVILGFPRIEPSNG
jgi:hypothetical protein